MLADSRIDREVETLPPGRLLQHSNFWHRGNLAIVVSDVQSLQIPRLAARTFSQSLGLERHGCDALLPLQSTTSLFPGPPRRLLSHLFRLRPSPPIRLRALIFVDLAYPFTLLPNGREFVRTAFTVTGRNVSAWISIRTNSFSECSANSCIFLFASC